MQKLIILVIFEFIMIIFFIFALKFETALPTEQVNLKTENSEIQGDLSKIPDNNRKSMNEKIFNFLAQKFPQDNISNIKDIAVRDNSFQIKNNNSFKEASFIIDIDSLKQSYNVKYGWENGETKGYSSTFSIECLPKNQMKYQETFCEGMTTTTASPQLYLPKFYLADNKKDSYNITLEGNEIKAYIAICGSENQTKYKKDVDNYLKSTPIDFQTYTVKYQYSCYKK